MRNDPQLHAGAPEKRQRRVRGRYRMSDQKMSDQNSPMAASTLSSAEYSRDLLLRDGAVLRVRSMRPDDRQALRDLFARCSPQSIRFRFLHQVKELTEDMLDKLTDTDSSRHVALVVTQGEGRDERVVAVGRYQVQAERPGVAEVSFLVEDAMQ